MLRKYTDYIIKSFSKVYTGVSSLHLGELQFNPNQEEKKDLEYFKNATFYILSILFLILGLLPIGYGAYLFFQESYIIAGVLELLTYLVILFLMLNNRINILTKRYVFVWCVFLLGLMLLFVVGPTGAGMIVIFAAFGLSACLLNKRQNIVFISINLLVFIAISIFFHFGLLDNLAIHQYRESWYIVAISTQCMGILFVLIISSIFGNINDQLSEIAKKARIIEERNMELADANTKTQQLLEDLKKEQKLIESIFDSIPGYLYVYDEGEKLIKWNKKHETMTGFTAEELSSMTLEKWFDQEDIVKVRAAVRDVFDKGYGEVEAQLILKNGEKMMTRSSGAPLILDGKKYFAGIGIDITERKEMEKTIDAEQKRAQRYLDIASDIFLSIDCDANVTLINKKGCEILGIEKNDILGKNWIDQFITESDVLAVKALFEKIFSGELDDVEFHENKICTKNGEERLISWHNTILNDEKGNITGLFASGIDITDSKEAEVQRQQTMHDLLESQRIAHLGTWRLNLATNQVVWSEELYKMYGFDPKLPPPPYTEHMKLFTPESWEKLSNALEQTRTIGIPYELELETVTKEGSNGWMWVRGEAEKDSKGNIVSLHGAAQDITAQKKMEYEIRQSEERFQLLFNKAPLGYQSLDSEGCFMEVNQKWLDSLGYSKEEVIGKWFGDFLCTEYIEGFRQRFPIFKAQGHIYSEFEMLTKDGQRKTMAFEGRIGNDAEGKFIQTHCILQDITKQRKAEKALIESEERYKALFENAGVGIGYYSKEGIVLSYNRLALKNIGGKLEDYKGKSIRELFPKEMAEIYFSRIEKAITSDEPQEYEDCLALKSAPKWFLSTFTKIVNTTGEVLGVQIASLDITERKTAEDELLYLSNHDHLTGLYNRRFYDLELKRLDSSEYLPLSIIVCDINGLKLINDSLGHDAGDQVIKNIAKAIKNACRTEDIIVRTGGDEFIVILPMTSSGESLEIAKHMKEFASKESIQNIEVSISYGQDTKETEKQSIIEIIANAENYMYRNKLHERSSMRSKTIDLIMSTLFEKSKRESAHSNRVGNICESIAFKMNLDKDTVNQMRIAGFIHDIGKIGIDEKILNKPGSLTVDERREIEKHPEIGWRLLSSTKEFSELAQFVLSHHEKWDGSGYPNRIRGEEIPLEARIICVADSYDAMTTERSYRKGLSKEEAIKELLRCAGTQFDPEIVDIFVNQIIS